ncbi:glucose-1-phosphate thymidylyltransferase RfbA [bacterium]|nr:glucose-1-phosphate thymidylyltransferase RfbA [bacterium]
MKGIVLAGGTGTRLHPLTYGVSKQLLPVYDKPMIYYPISTLMLAGIREILLITTPADQQNYIRALGDGSQFGINLQYAIQEEPLGLAQAFVIGESFIGNESVCLILGDNLFWGQGLIEMVSRAGRNKAGATVFAAKVKDPRAFGVIEVNSLDEPISIEEKPMKPKSNFAVTGLYFYNNDVVKLAKLIEPSERGEYEITSINQYYMERKELRVELLGRGFAWLDMGHHDSLLAAGNLIETVQSKQGYMVGCLEEIALNNDWLSAEELERNINLMGKSSYRTYLDVEILGRSQ